jgi:hypothetical protein
MEESALRSALASLDDCNSSLHWWLGFWTVWVVVGVALELVFVVWEYIDELHDFRRGIVHPPDRPNGLLFVLGFFATGLVVLGVGGELHAESKIATLETCVRRGNDELFLLLSKEAGGAAKSAKTAHEEAGAVKGIADEAKKEVAEVKSEAADIEERLKWRSLTPKQQKEIAEALQSDGKWDVDLLAYGDASEIRRIADQIRLSLPPGWNARIWFIGSPAWTVTGIVVQTVEGSGKDANAVADHIVSALRKESLLAGHFPSMPRSFNPTAGVSFGPLWDKDKISPIRISIGAKQEIPPRR